MAKEYQLGVWSLKELFSSIDGDDVSIAMEELDNSVQDFENYRETLTIDIDAKEFLKIIDHNDAYQFRVIYRGHPGKKSKMTGILIATVSDLSYSSGFTGNFI